MNKKLLNYNNTFDYFLIKSKNRKKTITAKVIGGVLYVYTPLLCGKNSVDNFIGNNKEKIEKLIKKVDYENITYLGEKYLINIVNSKIIKFSTCYINEQEKIFIIYKPENQENINITEIVDNWKKLTLKNIIEDRIKFFISKYKFNYDLLINRLTIKNTRTIWGSCSAKHNLNFNLNLIEKRIELIDYVIIHELTHTIYFNHSKSFWLAVENIIPNYLDLKKELNKK